MNAKHTPGPLFVHQPESFPFDIQIVDAKEDVVFCESRYAYSSKQKTVEDVMQGRGFPVDQRDAVIAANERQLADMNLRAAAPDLLEALRDLIDSHWLEDSHAVEFDGTVLFSQSYDFSNLHCHRRSELRMDGFECVVWPGGYPDYLWSAYSTYDGSMWFEEFASEDTARAVCVEFFAAVMPEHPVSKARAAIAKATGEPQ